MKCLNMRKTGKVDSNGLNYILILPDPPAHVAIADARGTNKWIRERLPANKCNLGGLAAGEHFNIRQQQYVQRHYYLDLYLFSILRRAVPTANCSGHGARAERAPNGPDLVRRVRARIRGIAST